MPITWTGALYAVDTPTGDNRIIDRDALELPTPFPLRYVDEDRGEHDGAVTVGTVTETWQDGDLVRARGTFDEHSPRALEAARLAKSGIKAGISIDPDSSTIVPRVFAADGTEIPLDTLSGPEDIPPGATVYRAQVAGRVRAATIVDIPAFIEARIEQVDVTDLAVSVPGLTAAAASHTGAMVALVPDEASAGKMAVDGYEPPDVLHVTLFFLGDADAIDDPARKDILRAVASAVDAPEIQDLGIVDGKAWAVASFNPDAEQAATYLIGGPELAPLRRMVEQALLDGAAFALPDQHQPWIPHVTVGYDLDPSTITEPALGPVAFDRIRVAFGSDDVHDYPLRSKSDMSEEVEERDPDDTEPEPEPEPAPALTAAAVPPHSTDSVPGEWDGTAVEKALPTGEDPSFYADYYAYHNEDKGDGTAKDHWHYLHHYREGDTGRAGAASVTACRSIIGILNGARGLQTKASGGDRQTVYDHVARHMVDAGYEPPPLQTSVQYAADTDDTFTFDDTIDSDGSAWEGPAMTTSAYELQSTDPDPECDLSTLTGLTASAGDPALAIPQLPADHFTPFDLVDQTPLTLTESGQVFGHVALDRICHVGMPKCVTMPRSASGLRYFHTGVTRLDDGSDIATGRITMRGSHADVRLNWRSAMAHYDDVTTAIADVVAVEDDHGIAVFGHVRPGTPPELVHAFRASTPSGDWRALGSGPELINIHMVNSPGFPVYRTEGDRLVTSIAASAAPARLLSGDIPASMIASAGGFPDGHGPDHDLDQDTRIARKVIEILQVDAATREAFAAMVESETVRHIRAMSPGHA